MNITTGQKKVTLSGSGLSNLLPGDQLTDSAGVIPVADPLDLGEHEQREGQAQVRHDRGRYVGHGDGELRRAAG